MIARRGDPAGKTERFNTKLERRYWSGALGTDELALAYGGIDCPRKSFSGDGLPRAALRAAYSDDGVVCGSASFVHAAGKFGGSKSATASCSGGG